MGTCDWQLHAPRPLGGGAQASEPRLTAIRPGFRPPEAETRAPAGAGPEKLLRRDLQKGLDRLLWLPVRDSGVPSLSLSLALLA
jgi:hypothetical protein